MNVFQLILRNRIKGCKDSLLILLFFSLISVSGQTQQAARENTVGINVTIASQALDQSREIQIYLPESYANDNKSFPVLYVLDGQRFFLYAVSLLESFKQYSLTPEFIVVGITNRYPQRFGHFGGGRDKFTAFVKQELLPFIKGNYRTNNDQIIFGWEYGGSFAMHLLTKQPALFSSYLLASPFPIEGAVDALSGVKTLNKNLFFSVSPNEHAVNHGVEKLDSLLSKKPIAGLDWTFTKLSNAAHRSTPYMTLYNGLRNYFKYYPELQIDDLDDFLNKGGIQHARAYNKNRADHYGFDAELSGWTKFTIIRSAMRADRFDHFDRFVETFKSEAFISSLRGSRPYDIAAYYEKNKAFDNAISIYNILVKKDPSDSTPHKKLTAVYTVLKDKRQARKHNKRVEALSKGKN